VVTVKTDLGDLRESARRVRFEQAPGITDTNVQDAIKSAHGLTFSRNPQTANYAVQNTDKGNLLALGGNALFTLTVNAASGYDANFAIIVYNEDAGRGKVIAANGRTSFILWPHQTVLIFNDNNAWKFSPDSQRWRPSTGSVTFNVDNVNGSDSSTNDGLGAQGTSGAFATVQHALSIIDQSLDQPAITASIQLPPITGANPITEQLSVAGAMPMGISEISVVGNPASPTSCQWQVGSEQICATLTDYRSVTFNGIDFSTGGNGNISQITQYAIGDFVNCVFGANIGGDDFAVSAQGRCNILSGCTISGSCTQFLQVTQQGNAGAGSSIAIVGTPNVGIFANANEGSEITLDGLVFTGAGTISGQSFLARWNGTIDGDSGVSWPGSMSAGQAYYGGISDAGISAPGSVIFSNLPAAPITGTTAVITDSTTNTWGANITVGGGSDTVLAWFNGSHWTVLGK
jgi:hypothetical protein